MHGFEDNETMIDRNERPSRAPSERPYIGWFAAAMILATLLSARADAGPTEAPAPPDVRVQISF